ncbi:MAG TPA: agmatine deiminase [Rubneribacter badeniensis]|uniref:Putative agmatine deiminase n=1 Tax=Rubneribacter badeniensis TaxID=2070688 RepID=A0A9D2VLG2_9ACTN|nr:agmatine deiminase [Rubneribacter badeniensis]
MKTIYENESTPKADGFRMPAEFEPQTRVWMLWPHRTDNWRDGAKPAQRAYAEVARAIARFEPVVVGANPEDYEAAHYALAGEDNILVIEMASDDAWIRDCGPTFVVDDNGGLRAVHWHFNAWGGLVDGLYFPWDQDALVGMKVADLARADRYRPDSLVLEGGSIHVDGEGTVLTTEMCLLSEGRNPELSREQIEDYLRDYLNVEKVIWIKDGIDPEETNGHIDDVACFVRPGEVGCIWTDDETNPFYEAAHAAYDTLSNATDAKGRQLKVHKLTMPQVPTYMSADEVAAIDVVEGTLPRTVDDVAIASYMNFLIVNGGVIVPQYDDPNDELALEQVRAMFPDREVVGVRTREIAYGGGNIHCITQQEPAPQSR